jgi:hypothetical protein
VLAGSFEGFLDFEGGPLLSGDASNIFLAALDAPGQHRWSKRFGSAGPLGMYRVILDSVGNIWVTGMLGGDTDFGNGTLSSAGGKDMFVASFNP